MKAAFTAADRARIREALRRYAREHRIGVPSLQRRIAQATGRLRSFDTLEDPPMVPRSTLQRFLRGERPHTNDSMVAVYDQFVSQAGRGELETLEVALAAFHGAAVQDVPLRFAGKTLRTFVPGGGAEVGTFSVSLSEKPAGKAQERVYRRDPLISDDENAAEPGTFEFFEGIYIAFARFGVAHLRSALTGYPRHHVLKDEGEGAYASTCQEGRYLPADEQPCRLWLLSLSEDERLADE